MAKGLQRKIPAFVHSYQRWTALSDSVLSWLPTAFQWYNRTSSFKTAKAHQPTSHNAVTIRIHHQRQTKLCWLLKWIHETPNNCKKCWFFCVTKPRHLGLCPRKRSWRVRPTDTAPVLQPFAPSFNREEHKIFGTLVKGLLWNCLKHWHRQTFLNIHYWRETPAYHHMDL